MVTAAFKKRIIATELFDGWAQAARRNAKVRSNYRPVYKGNWFYLVPKAIQRPSPKERLMRYRALSAYNHVLRHDALR